MHIRTSDTFFSYQIIRQSSYIPQGAGDFGEILQVTKQIKKGNLESWISCWSQKAEEIEQLAWQSLHNKDLISARRAFQRASSYYWLAEFFVMPRNSSNERLITLYKKSVAAFREALKLWHTPVEMVSIPYEGTTLSAYFFKPNDDDNTPKPTLLCMGGFDSTLEGEVPYILGMDAVKRGYNVLAFEGPGQGAPLRLLNLPSRYDYEVPVRAAVDYVCSRTDVDTSKLVLLGNSFGGYYAARAVCFEHRLAALVINGALYDAFVAIPTPLKIMSEGLRNYVAGIVQTLLPQANWGIGQNMWVMGAQTPHDALEVMQDFHLQGIAHQIKCPLLIMHGENAPLIPVKQAQILYNTVGSRDKKLHTFKGSAGLHCQVGNMEVVSPVVFPWLKEVLHL